MQRSNMFLKAFLLSNAVLLSLLASKAGLTAELNCKTSYTVVIGDTLGSIAERAYGSSAQFNRIYYANQDVLPAGPTVIRIGQELRIPCAEAEEKADVGDTGTQEIPRDIVASGQTSNSSEQSSTLSEQTGSTNEQVGTERIDTEQADTTVQDVNQDTPVSDQLSLSADTGTNTEPAQETAMDSPTDEDTKASVTVPETKSAENTTAEPLSQPQHKLELLTAGDYAPFTDPELDGGGLITELLETLMKRSEIPYRLDWINDWAAHLNPLLAEKKYDIGFPWLDPGCPESDSPRCDFLFSKPVFELLIVLFTRADEPLIFSEDDHILGKTLCRPIGYFTHDLDNNGRNWLKEGKITLKRPKNVEDCFKLLIDGDVDAVAINDFTGRESIAKLGISDKVMLLERELSIEGLHALVHKTHPSASTMIEQINRGLEELHTSGQYDTIMDRHLRNHWKSVESKQ